VKVAVGESGKSVEVFVGMLASATACSVAVAEGIRVAVFGCAVLVEVEGTGGCTVLVEVATEGRGVEVKDGADVVAGN
jgi:hypothetical protein